MSITLLKSKIHRATVTQAELDYIGSITIDQALLDAAGLFEYERVEISNIDNGARFATYVIAGEPGSGTICLNGAAAHCAKPGDKIIIMAYADIEPEQAPEMRPKVVFVDERNQAVCVTRYEKHGRLEDLTEVCAEGAQS